MKKNVRTIDRVLRIIIGLGIIAYGVMEQSLLGVIGLVPLVTAFMGWCPVYTMFGVSHCGVNKNASDKNDEA